MKTKLEMPGLDLEKIAFLYYKYFVFLFFTQFIFVGNFNCLLELKLFSFLSMDIIKAEESVLFVFLHRVESINSSTFTKRGEENMTKKE